MNKILEVKMLNKTINKKHIIKNLTFDINEKEIFGFLGKNGSGKTTTIKLITKLLFKDSGDVSVCGNNINNDFEKYINNIGVVFESGNHYEYMTGLENINLQSNVRNISKDRVTDVINKVGLENKINSKVSTYSFGMKQRLSIAIAILHSPKLLILDEPTNGLDPNGVKELRILLKELVNKFNISIFISSHMLSEIEVLCDNIAIINDGTIVKTGKIKDILKDQLNQNVYIIEVDDIDKSKKLLKKLAKYKENKIKIIVSEDKLQDVSKELINNDIKILSINRQVKKLEDVFFDLTGGNAND